MGGRGSGRKPDPLKEQSRQSTPFKTGNGEELFLPNYSGVKNEISEGTSNISINDIPDVDVTNRADDRVLVYNASSGNMEYEDQAGGGGDNDKVGVDSGATAGYLGAASNDGVLRTSTGLSYTDGGDYVTLSTNDSEIDHDSLTNTHNLTTDIDHNSINNYASNEHIDWTGTNSDISCKDLTLSGSGTTTDDLTASGSAVFRNVLIGTESTPPTASNHPQGTIYLQYTA